MRCCAKASARHMHVLVTMPVSRLSVGGGEVRFWMTRGIAGCRCGQRQRGGSLGAARGALCDGALSWRAHPAGADCAQAASDPFAAGRRLPGVIR